MLDKPDEMAFTCASLVWPKAEIIEIPCMYGLLIIPEFNKRYESSSIHHKKED